MSHFPFELPITKIEVKEFEGFNIEQEMGVRHKRAVDTVISQVKDEYTKQTVLENRELLK